MSRDVVSDGEFEEILERNKQISSSAIGFHPLPFHTLINLNHSDSVIQLFSFIEGLAWTIQKMFSFTSWTFFIYFFACEACKEEYTVFFLFPSSLSHSHSFL